MTDAISGSRRGFLHMSAAGALAPWGLKLGALAALAAPASPRAADASDYKALICLYLDGGNDQDNTLVPYDDASYGRYVSIRGIGSTPIALARSALGNTVLTPSTALPGGRQYALHPSLQGLADLFHRGRVAALLNVGPLIVPLTRRQYHSGDRRFPLPPKLFSHIDQRSTFLSGGPEGTPAGYGGAMADEYFAGNATPLLTSIQLSGNGQVFLTGNSVLPYRMTSSGPVAVSPVVNEPGRLADTLSSIIQSRHTHVLEDAYSQIVRYSMATQSTVAAALGNYQPSGGASELSRALRMVVQMASVHAALGMRRQVFLVRRHAFDTHGAQLGIHATALAEVSSALVEFDAAATAAGVADKLTLFTTSDFGRTLTCNGDGTDHGWGGHHFVLGGAVRGGRIYGTAPPVSVGNTDHPDDQWHVGQGRLLPSTSVAQYMATLALWFGVPMQRLPEVISDISNFGSFAGRADYPVDIGFMRA